MSSDVSGNQVFLRVHTFKLEVGFVRDGIAEQTYLRGRKPSLHIVPIRERGRQGTNPKPRLPQQVISALKWE